MLRELLANKRLLTYLLINMIVSAATTLLVIALWMHFTLAGKPSFATQSAGSQVESQLQITAIVGAGDMDNEHVTIELVGNTDLSLAGWVLRDQDGNEYRFPALVLHPGAQVNLFTKKGEDTASELYWGRQTAAWSSGEEVSLFDASGRLQATYTVP